MTSEDNQLRDLLSDEAKRERHVYKRASLPVAIAAAVGLVWLAYSAYKVTTLEHRSSQLASQIEAQTKELGGLRDERAKINDELADYARKLNVAKEALDEARKGFQTIATGTGDPKLQAKQAIRQVNNASAVVNATRTTVIKATATPTPDSTVIKATPPPASNTGNEDSQSSGPFIFRVKKGAWVTVEINYSGERPHIVYSLDGSQQEMKGDPFFGFTVYGDRNKPTRLMMTFSFDSRGASYQVKISTGGTVLLDKRLNATAWIRVETFLFETS